MSPAIKTKLENVALKINDVINSSLTTEKEKANGINTIIDDFINNTQNVSTGGKRLRGALVYFSYIMLGGKSIKEIIKVAAAVELTHSYILVDDDIMDKSALRRGVKTIHTVYKELHESKYKYAESQHFGHSIAIIGGIFLCHVASNLLLNTKFDNQLKLTAQQKLNNCIIETSFGQVLDLFGEVLEDKVDEEYIKVVQKFKTSKYTYENPLHLGAMFAGGTSKDFNALTKYAIPAGIAFQMQDDILGMFGEEDVIGKPADSDLKEGKHTLLISYALKNSTSLDREYILNALGNSRIGRPALEKVRKLIKKSGALEYSQELARKFVKEAIEVVNKQKEWLPEGKQFLTEIAEYSISRKY